MRQSVPVELSLAGHRDLTEHALQAVRADHTLDDRERSRRITALIEAANARAVELMRKRSASLSSPSSLAAPAPYR